MDSERIPQDIAATAKRITEMDWYEGAVFSEIASALMAERHRCAKIVEDYEPSDFIGWEERGELAAAIRKP